MVHGKPRVSICPHMIEHKEILYLSPAKNHDAAEHEKAGCGHLSDSGRRRAGPQRPQRRPRRRLPVRRLACPLFRRKVGLDHDPLDQSCRRPSCSVGRGTKSSQPKSTDPADEIAMALNATGRITEVSGGAIPERRLDQGRPRGSVVVLASAGYRLASLPTCRAYIQVNPGRPSPTSRPYLRRIPPSYNDQGSHLRRGSHSASLPTR